MKIPTTLDRKNMKKGLKSPAPASVLALKCFHDYSNRSRKRRRIGFMQTDTIG